MERVNANQQRLITEMGELLRANGYRENALEPIYSCTNCKDTGVAGHRWCRCRDLKYVEALYAQSGLGAAKTHTLDNFDFSLYSETASNEYPISPRENISHVLSIALNFIQGKEEQKRNLLFYGSTGLGKTFLSDCIANKLLSEGKVVFYMSASRLLTCFEDYKFGRDTSEDAKRRINLVYNAELLIIDDLGTEFRTSYSDSSLFDIINSRLLTGGSMIISTNQNLKGLHASYSERIVSRILGNFELCPFFGEDIRLKKMLK